MHARPHQFSHLPLAPPQVTRDRCLPSLCKGGMVSATDLVGSVWQ